jgi:hypothetical protein
MEMLPVTNDPESRRTIDVSLIGVFAALIAFSSLVPLSIVIGGTGVFSLAWVMQTLTGIILGPYIGGVAALVGGSIGNLINPSIFGPIGSVLPAIAAIQAGLVVWRRWQVAALTLFSLIVLWFLVLFLVPDGLVAWPVTVFHILGAAILVTLGGKLSPLIREARNARSTYLAWGLTAYCANVSRHMFGNILLVAVLAYPPEGFLLALPFTAIEQTMFAISSALIGASILLAVKNTKLNVPITRLDGP